METTVKITHSDDKITYTRFDISQRIEHIVFLLSFSLLGFTGLIQKFSNNQISDTLIFILGGIEKVRIIHHYSAIVMMIVSGYHVLVLAYKVFVLRVRWSMLPVIEDIQHLFQDVLYFFGFRKHRAYYGRYNYAEKAEYLAVVWGTIIMGLSGFMMWNPLSTTRLLPGDFIPAAKAAHGAEAILAVLAIIIWHFYHVHIKHFNKSMFTGKLNRTEMMHEHPAELAQIEAGPPSNRTPFTVIRRRQQVFFPAALLFTAAFSFGIYKFANFEVTAITTIPQGETVQVYVPVTPTPRPSPTAPPTLVPGAEVGAMTWEDYFSGLFRNRCNTCHGFTKVGGLSLASYQDALNGGNSGPAIVPGDPDNSVLVQKQSKGDHPGQLTIDELNQVIDWIKAGAPEK
ncbi:MAG TPA: cytochrome b/b6 domain-containing protein [Anaerolineales bacterium]|nr:cytochrome b/b6 domain-containing protein [Anaerolineales bacterium]